MRHPKIILHPDTYPIGSDPVSFTEYKYHKVVHPGCYEYIYWWQNGEGKWKCFKLFFEYGNVLYRQYQKYLKDGNDESGWSCKFIDFEEK